MATTDSLHTHRADELRDLLSAEEQLLEALRRRTSTTRQSRKKR